ncbi:uncharacterized protein LOC133180628 [Saccostrea echinata]|uniref:uncharacterized protein LOC133180628 n=1 Tax=Saccostrea echinata TaxID=191078 RepID=UPI002A7FF2FC|nr:uncharacterized protein LOC133180628 [Saccostrea echinata]
MNQVPDTAQHIIECGTESCRKFSEFYCNTCHQPMCDQCKQRHLEQNKGHEIVRYQARKRKLPSEKCRIHPSQDIDNYCKVCQDPLCSTCFHQHHSDHVNRDLETIYNDILQQCQKEINDIWKTVIPKTKHNIESNGEKRENVKKEIAKTRISMKKRADELKKAVDSILTYNNKILDDIENSVLNDMEEEQRETEDYINYLEEMISNFESKMSSIKPTELMKFHLDISLATMKMPNEIKPKLPIFTLGALNKKEIAKQFGEIELDSSETFKLSSVIKVNQLTFPGHTFYHLSLLPPKKFWANDRFGNLILYDMEGHILSKKILTSIWNSQGINTVTAEGELLYTDNSKKTVNRVTSDMSINNLIETGNWKPGAIFSSPINGHILVGMERISENKISRYTREGRKLQDIQWDDKGQTLYQSIFCITENINGDIGTSDKRAKKVKVVTKSGKYRFSYSGHHSQLQFCPYGVCTNVHGHILVCNGYNSHNENSSSVHLLDINGRFLSFLLTSKHCPPYTCALCVDDQHNLLVGRSGSSTVSVYKYLQYMEK